MLKEALTMPLSYFTDPEKRLHVLYLTSSALLAYIVFFKSKKKTSFLHYLFNKKVFLSSSAKVDYALVVFNSFIKVLLVGPYLIYGLYLAFHTNDFLITMFGYPSFTLSPSLTLVLYTICLTLFSDLAAYLLHYALHRFQFLWEFHKVHHSATTLNPFTQYRIHPVELLLNNARNIIVFGLTMGVFDYLSQYQVNKLLFFGVNVFSFIFLLWGSNLRHSHVKFKYVDSLESLFISPFQHQIHHSNNPSFYNKNMGVKLAIWDWLFGTLVKSKEMKDVEFGLGEIEDKEYRSFWANLFLPFKRSLKSLIFFHRGRT